MVLYKETTGRKIFSIYRYAFIKVKIAVGYTLQNDYKEILQMRIFEIKVVQQ